jgi:phosphohistidine swiveling domain-containing protein
LFDDPRLSVTQRSWRPFLRRAARVAFRYRIPPRMLEALVRPGAARRRAEREHARLRARLASPAQFATAAQRLDPVERVLATETIPLAPRIMPGAAAGFLMFGLATRLLGDKAGPGDLLTVLRGMPYNVTTEMDLALWRLAERLRAAGVTAERLTAGPLPPVAETAIAEFMERYGHRAVAEIDLGVPRWSEDPAHVIGVLANYLRLDDPDLAPDRVFARGAREATAMIDELAARVGGPRGRLVRFALGRTRALGGIRELPKFTIVMVLAAMRRQLAAVGAELAARGVVAEEGDIFFLTLPEARAALRQADPEPADYRALVAERRATYDREMLRRHIPRVMLSDGTEPEAVAAPGRGAGSGNGNPDELTGTPASAGTVTGVARVVLDPVGAHLEPGEILVAPSTDPGWTPLFLTSGGLVMEMGVANSHGAVVAREYGIPAVVGVHGATERIATGQRITVDGATGIVTLV